MTIYQLLSAYQQARSIYEMPVRVAYYARVSSEKDEQLHSLDNQIDYYEQLIHSTPSWTYVRGYVDEGITGTSTKGREQFLQMIADGKAGQFDLLITKEISRFARNTLDSIGYTRALFAAGVGVFFQNDNINTLAPDGELRLTILSSIAQDEVRKLSQRVRYGFRCSQDKGVVLGNSAIWGYTKDKGKLKRCPREAPVVERIFREYAETGVGLRTLSAQLAEEGILNRNGKPFSYSTLRSILSNPKYKGYYCARKTAAPPLFLPEGGGRQVFPPQEWIIYPNEEAVPPIVSPELWEAANAKLRRRGKGQNLGQAGERRAYSGKLWCSRHQLPYYRTVYHPSAGERPVWMCPCYQRHGRDPEEGCDRPVIYEDELRRGTAAALNQRGITLEQGAELLAAVYGEIAAQGTGHTWEQRKELERRQQRLVELWLDGGISPREYGQKRQAITQALTRLEEDAAEQPPPTAAEILPVLASCPTGMEGALQRIEVQGNREPELSVTLDDGSVVGLRLLRRRGRETEVVVLSSERCEQGT